MSFLRILIVCGTINYLLEVKETKLEQLRVKIDQVFKFLVRNWSNKDLCYLFTKDMKSLQTIEKLENNMRSTRPHFVAIFFLGTLNCIEIFASNENTWPRTCLLLTSYLDSILEYKSQIRFILRSFFMSFKGGGLD